jgi:predicted RNA methylase
MARLVWVLLLAVSLAACAGGIPGVDGGTNEPVALDVIFVPTDLAVVNAMLALAGVTRDDIVDDLGCGDGRIVIAAAKELGARGVGVDLGSSCRRSSMRGSGRSS